MWEDEEPDKEIIKEKEKMVKICWNEFLYDHYNEQNVGYVITASGDNSDNGDNNSEILLNESAVNTTKYIII